MATKTAKPSGLTITRNDTKFKFKWKRNNSPDAQQLEWRRSYKGKYSKKWNKISITKTATSATASITKSDYYPTKGVMGRIQFRVRGKKDGKWSAWVYKVMKFSKTDKPTATATWSSEYVDQTNFAWETVTSTSNAKIFTDVQWEAVLQTGYNEETIKSTKKWTTLTDYRSGTGVASSSTNILEVLANIQSGSHTRWFRCRSRGPNGASGWAYAKHVYAQPYQAIITGKSAKVVGSGTRVNVNWNVDGESSAYPVDNVVVRYAMVTPAAGLAPPSDISGSWEAAVTAIDKGSTGATSFDVGDVLDDDQCLFVQVNTIHDANTTYGSPAIAQFGSLSAPTGLSVTTVQSTHKATVTATNNSAVPDSFLAVKYSSTSNPNGLVLGIIPNGSSSVTIQCPNWDNETAINFEVYAVQGTYTTTTSKGVTEYRINANMVSDTLSQGGSIPVAPTSVTATPGELIGTIQVKWGWSWSEATGAELSWSDRKDAWESTNEPSTYEVTNLHASQWNISDLETGQTWYVRVRLFSSNGDETTYGAYSPIKEVDLSSAPSTPFLYVSSGVVPVNGMTTATWAYVSNDGTPQRYAEICEASFVNNVLQYGRVIASTKTSQHIDLYPKRIGWATGTVHYLCLRVQSASGKMSDTWSDPVPVTVAAPVVASITSTSLVQATETIDGTTRSFMALTQLPLTVSVSGAADSNNVTVAVERAKDYYLDRPDESLFNGYEGETVALVTRSGDGSVSIDADDQFGMLDDGASYRIVVTITDELGQGDTTTQEFEVQWSHQALIPTANIAMEGDIATITTIQPTGAVEGDTCDIYRLSVDKPELIVQGAAWGTKYVDPYPTIGNYGGYRVVFKTLYGDYITDDGILAWTDYSTNYYKPKTLIDFGGEQAQLMLDMTLSSEWSKDFQETQYLGGSVKGDWNPAISRKGSVNATTIRYIDMETIASLHDLADYAGICHVRMPDGSNFHADVEVSLSDDFGDSPKTTECSLTITRVDGEGLDGLTYAEWSEG